MDTKDLDRFLSKVEPDTDTGCWNWTAFISEDGYGSFWFDGRMRGAHRVSYLHFKGDMPEGWETDHLCRNRACVFYDHLEAVPKKVNVLRGYGPTAINADIEVCKRGHLFTDETTRINQKGSRVCIPCEKEYMKAYYAKHRDKLIDRASENKKKLASHV